MLHLKAQLSIVVLTNMEHQAAASPTSRKEQVARNYRNRYNTDPEFREKERQRAAAYIDSRRDHYNCNLARGSGKQGMVPERLQQRQRVVVGGSRG
jgi:hypothetical protein